MVFERDHPPQNVLTLKFHILDSDFSPHQSIFLVEILKTQDLVCTLKNYPTLLLPPNPLMWAWASLLVLLPATSLAGMGCGIANLVKGA